MKPTHIRRALALKIPKMHSGGGGPTATTAGYIGYARDAAFFLDQLQGIAYATAYQKHEGYDPFWDDCPEKLLQRLEAWHAARAADDWTLAHAGEAQPGEWRALPTQATAD